MDRRFTLLIRDEGDGMLWAKVEELPGCFASGSDMDELLEAAAEAIGMYLSGSDVTVQLGLAPTERPSEQESARILPWPDRPASTAPHYAVEMAQICVEA